MVDQDLTAVHVRRVDYNLGSHKSNVLTQDSIAVITFGAHWSRAQQHLSDQDRNEIMWLSTLQQLLISHRLECDSSCGQKDTQEVRWPKHIGWSKKNQHQQVRRP